VTLHIYNVGQSKQTALINAFLRKLGTGAFHCGVEAPSFSHGASL
jgi:hypothetical protein